jgi:hypothetical protein
MLYNFSFLLLWRPLLLDLLTRGTSNGKSQISPDDFQFAQACINLAETCRSRTEEASQEHRANVFSWSPIYTSFLSELYVLALLSVESLRPQLECTNDLSALGGYRRLAASRCGDACATPAMDLLKVSRKGAIRMVEPISDMSSTDRSSPSSGERTTGRRPRHRSLDPQILRHQSSGQQQQRTAAQ